MESISNYEYTDIGCAKRFVDILGGSLKWVPEVNGWFRFQDGRWKEDKDGAVYRAAERVSEKIAMEGEIARLEREAWVKKNFPTFDEKDKEKKKELAEYPEYMRLSTIITETKQWAKDAQNISRIKAFIELAKHQPGMTVSYELFDSKGQYLGCPNGVVDLRTGELVRENKKSYLLAKSTSVPYAEDDGGCPMWEETIHNAMCGDNEKIEFLHRLLGSGLIGQEAKYFTIFLGEGQNLKTTITKTIKNVLGDYAQVGDVKTLLTARPGASEEYQLAGMKGARFVSFNEVPRNDLGNVVLTEQLVKKTIDSEPIRVRQIYGKPFEYQPVFTPILSVNHLPTISMDLGTKRRLVIISFDYKIPTDVARISFTKEMIEKEGPQILRWLVKGAIKVLKDGLSVPKKLAAETTVILEEQDIISAFIKDRWFRSADPSAKVSLDVFWRQFQEWAFEVGHSGAAKWSRQTMKQHLKEREFVVKQAPPNNSNMIYGLSDKPAKVVSKPTLEDLPSALRIFD